MEQAKPSSSRPYLIAIAILVAAFGIYLLLPLFKSEKLPVIMEEPDYTLTNVDGSEVSRADLSGKVRLVEFFFTSCPDICPVTTANMVAMQEPLKEKGYFASDVWFVGITFDPETDTLEQLARYAERMDVDMSGWSLLRGESEEVLALAGEYGFTIQKLGDGQFVHPITSLLLIDRDNQVRKIYRMGEDMDTELILNDIEKLVKEK